MKRTFKYLMLMIFGMMLSGVAMAQHPEISIRDLQYVSQAKLNACSDTSAYFLDTVTVVGVVVQDANLIDVPSSSVQGGFRPFVHVVDTADGGASGNFAGLQVMGVYQDASGADLPVSDIYNLYAGMIIKVTGIVNRYQGETQLNVLNNSALTVIGNMTAPTPIVVDLGDLNDNTRTNKLPTGEQYEDSYVELKDLTVSAVYNFSGNRVSFDVVDKDGNVMNVSDRFFAQKTSSYTTSRTSSPLKQGKFKAPVVGTKFDYIRGIIMHSENGCTGNSSGRGYEINPTRDGDYKIGVTPPNISGIVRTPLVPKDSEKVMITANIVDFDGSVQSASLFYTTNASATYDQFTEVTLTVKSGTTDTYEAEIPSASEGTVVRFYIKSTDDIGQISYSPFAATSMSDPDFHFYTVRNGGLTISDVQRVLYPARDASPFVNQVVTVTGVVTASAKAYDLENIYIQDPNETEWAGIKCQGNSELIKLFRGEEVTVTGTVAESFGLTVLNVTKVVRTGEVKNVDVIGLDPSDSAFYFSKAAEKYEGMLVGMTNPGGGKVYISNPRLSNFGEYQIATSADASYGRARRVQAGIQNTNNSSSLWVSIVSDTTLKSTDGIMNVEPILAEKGMSFDTVIGILYYGFSNYSLLPRNDDDFRGSSVTLPETMYPEMGSVHPVAGYQISVYPNPAEDALFIQVDQQTEVHVTLMDLSGRTHISRDVLNNSPMNISSLTTGMYLVRLTDIHGNMIGSARILVK